MCEGLGCARADPTLWHRPDQGRCQRRARDAVTDQTAAELLYIWTHTGRTLGTHGVTLAHCTEKPQSRAKGGLPQAPGMDGLRARAGHHATAHSSAGTAGRLQQLPLGERQSQLLAVDVSDGRKLFGLKAKGLGAKLGEARPTRGTGRRRGGVSQ